MPEERHKNKHVICPAAGLTGSKTCLLRCTRMKPVHEASVFMWSHTPAPWLVNVSVYVCVSQVCVRFSARGYDIRYRGGTGLKSLCMCVSDPSVVPFRQTVCVFMVNTVASVWSALSSEALWLRFHCLAYRLVSGFWAELNRKTQQMSCAPWGATGRDRP